MGILLDIQTVLGLAWWSEIKTDECTYYFGPFTSRDDALEAQPGYIEDLEQEGASNISASLMRGKPDQLTVEGAGDTPSRTSNPALT